MLFKRPDLDRLAAGETDLAFRCWARPRVKAGTRLRTPVGVFEVVSVDVVAAARITTREARRAGFASRDELFAALPSGKPGRIHRVRLRFAGADPRIALRRESSLDRNEVREIDERLSRMDARADSPWTREYLRLVADRPATRAADLAREVGVETRAFKARVRRLKELGLTESLEVGYRLSPRGKAFDRQRSKRSGGAGGKRSGRK